MGGNLWETAATAIALLAPLVGIPLTMITFYLKALREQQAGRCADLSQRMELSEAALRQMTEDLATTQRDYATKEEWLRECMWARARIERLTSAMARVETQLDALAGRADAARRMERAHPFAGASPTMSNLPDTPGGGIAQ